LIAGPPRVNASANKSICWIAYTGYSTGGPQSIAKLFPPPTTSQNLPLSQAQALVDHNVNSAAPQSLPSSQDRSTTHRKRGRPPSAKQQATGLKRPRGRPRKLADNTPETAAQAKRPVGRPRKSPTAGGVVVDFGPIVSLVIFIDNL
jgi:hypothetical protein